MLRKFALLASVAALLVNPQLALAQGAALVSGNPTTGHCAQWTNPNLLSDSGGACSGGGSGVSSFNTRTGAVTLSSSDVTTALTYTPPSISGMPTTNNCAKWISATQLGDAGAACGSGGGGGPVLLAILTASSSATLADTTHITSTYNNYTFVFTNLLFASSGALDIRFSTNGGSSYLTSGYSQSGGSGGTIQLKNFGGTTIVADNTNGGITGVLNLINPNSTLTYGAQIEGTLSVWDDNVSSFIPGVVTGANSTTSPVNAIEFYTPSGNIASGTIKIYGVP